MVELAAATLLPGLVDAHVHLAFDPTGHPLVDVVGVADDVLLSRMRANAGRALAAGITTMRDLGDALWVPQTPHTSCDLLILVEQSIKPVAPSDACCRARRSPGEWS